MDIASVVGTLLGFVCLGVVLFEVSDGHFQMFFSSEGLIMVGGGSISVLLMAMPLEKLKCVGGWVKSFLFYKHHDPVETIKTINELAEKARRDGILSVEQVLIDLEATDRFLTDGMRMVVDGTDPAEIEATLRLQLASMRERHKAGKKFFDLLKLYGPGWALAGTLVGQIGMFGNLESADVGKLGKMLAVAVCATMYGTVLANAFAGPMGDKLSMRSSEEIASRELVLQGILSIQAGDNPRLTLEKLCAFIPQQGREQFKKAA